MSVVSQVELRRADGAGAALRKSCSSPSSPSRSGAPRWRCSFEAMRKSDEVKFTSGLGRDGDAIAERTKAEVLHMGCRHEQRELCPARSLWAHPAHSFYPQQQQSGFPTDHFQPTLVREPLTSKDIELGER
ncbi:hypothetical protein KC337_g69 [Hortaea werneckii]|nr:hypothetical protein KC337_g69 [Hortaea werneckii]